MARIGVLAGALCFLVGAAAAQPAPSANDPLTQIFLPRIAAGADLNRFVEALRREFRQLDANLDGDLTAADAELHESIARAQGRALIAMTILNADLNGDGFVTPGELRQVLRYQRRNTAQPATSALEAIETEIRGLMAADTDGDGRISVAEAFAAKGMPNTGRTFGITPFGNPLATQVRQLLAADPDGDGKVTFAEFEATGTALFRKVDADGNGTVSQEELNDYRRREADAARERSEVAARAACVMPKASEAAKVVVLSAYKSEAISTVGLGSQDVTTGTGEIRIEPGEGPLYVVVISHDPTIWRITGETDRVERLVAFGATAAPTSIVLNGTPRLTASMQVGAGQPQPPLVAKSVAGITGLPADQVSFPERANCLRFFAEARSSDGAFVLAAVRRDSGKEPSVVAARQNAAAFSVPSGRIRSAYEDKKQPRLTIQKEAGSLTLKGDTSGVVIRTGPTDLESDLEQFSPGGVVDIDPATVVASVPAVHYDVLPGAAGLLQLQNSGAITRNAGGEFLIHQKIRLPAGLSGLSATFLLLRGVPIPDGRPDGARVISEETGQQVKFERP
jgi:Ca2+-binding EF-hand superfamily protein